MNVESTRIADQLRRAFTGEPWHGSPIRDLLDGVTPEQAQLRPLSSGHTIWELVLHIEAYVKAAYEAAHTIPMPQINGTDLDWPAVQEGTAAAWAVAKTHLFQDAEELAKAIDRFPDVNLKKTVPGREYNFYYLFHGIVQHSLYHGGQIAMLKKAIAISS